LFIYFISWDFKNAFECKKDTKTEAPTKLPNTTGNKLFKKNSLHNTSAPEKIPKGIKNIFATQCSNPKVTNVVIGIQINIILAIEFDVDACIRTAILTNQLANIPFQKATKKGNEVFETAILQANVATVPTPKLVATRAAKPTEATKFPIKLSPEYLHTYHITC